MSLRDLVNKDSEKRKMAEAAKLHAIAVEIIAKALGEITFDIHSAKQDKHNAAAIIAQLAGNDPPILLAYPDEIKD